MLITYKIAETDSKKCCYWIGKTYDSRFNLVEIKI